MSGDSFRFGEFRLDTGERLLLRGDRRLEVGGRYFDALALLVRESGRLVTKERFMDEVWRGVPVTDEALTQCIRSLRSELGDDAARPRFIETVPKHGYRFIGEVDGGIEPVDVRVDRPVDWPDMASIAGSAALGGALAGVGGGLFYGLVAASSAADGGMGAASALLVLLTINVLLGFAGGLGIGAGIAAARLASSDKWQWSSAGAMLGGLAVGGAAKLVGLDAFALLFGRAPEGMTGPAEGALLGAALGLAAWLAQSQRFPVGRSAAAGAAFGGFAGCLIPLLGGHLLGGSLAQLARDFPEGRFRLDAIARPFGEQEFGLVSELVTTTLEGALFGFCVVGALALVRGRTRRE